MLFFASFVQCTQAFFFTRKAPGGVGGSESLRPRFGFQREALEILGKLLLMAEFWVALSGGGIPRGGGLFKKEAWFHHFFHFCLFAILGDLWTALGPRENVVLLSHLQYLHPMKTFTPCHAMGSDPSHMKVSCLSATWTLKRTYKKQQNRKVNLFPQGAQITNYSQVIILKLIKFSNCYPQITNSLWLKDFGVSLTHSWHSHA